ETLDFLEQATDLLPFGGFANIKDAPQLRHETLIRGKHLRAFLAKMELQSSQHGVGAQLFGQFFQSVSLLDQFVELPPAVGSQQKIPESIKTLALARLTQPVLRVKRLADDAASRRRRIRLSHHDAFGHGSEMPFNFPKITEQLASNFEQVLEALVDLCCGINRNNASILNLVYLLLETRLLRTQPLDSHVGL